MCGCLLLWPPSKDDVNNNSFISEYSFYFNRFCGGSRGRQRLVFIEEYTSAVKKATAKMLFRDRIKASGFVSAVNSKQNQTGKVYYKV